MNRSLDNNCWNRERKGRFVSVKTDFWLLNLAVTMLRLSWQQRYLFFHCKDEVVFDRVILKVVIIYQNMKQFLPINVNGYLNCGRAVTLRNCTSYYGRHFSVLRPAQHLQDTRKEVLKKLILDLESHQNVCCGKRFSSGFKEKNFLMNFDVQIFPEFLKSLRNLYYFIFVMKSLDQSFTLMKFNESTITALEVVTYLLSQLRFSELEGLLTRRCKEEIESNLRTWPKQQVSALAVLPQRTIRCAPIDIFVSMDGENKEKTLVEITCAHYVWLKYSPEFDDDTDHMSLATLFMADYPRMAQNVESGVLESDKSGSNFKTLHMAAVFNSKYIREYRNGVDDQWTINAINCKCFSNIRAYF